MLSETSKKVMEIIQNQLESGDNKGLTKYGESIDVANNDQWDWNQMALEEACDMLKYQQKEIQYLKQRLYSFKKKTWFPIYEENLKLTEEKKTLIKTIDQLREELIKVGVVADKYYQQAVAVNEENTHLKEVLESVETFIGQFGK